MHHHSKLNDAMHPYIHAQTDPEKPALIMAGSGEIVTYKELDQRSNQGAHLFRSLGIKAETPSPF